MLFNGNLRIESSGGGTDVRTYGRTYGNSPLCPTGHRPFGAAAQKGRVDTLKKGRVHTTKDGCDDTANNRQGKEATSLRLEKEQLINVAMEKCKCSFSQDFYGLFHKAYKLMLCNSKYACVM